MMNNSLRLYVEKIENLPSLPVIAQEILTLADNGLVSVSRLEQIIENDPAISGKILSVANSAFYGFLTPSTTLNNAIMRIGFNSVKNIALGISIMTVLHDERHQRKPDYQRIFNHSVAVGFISKLMANRFKLNVGEDIFINGLLHDIGLLVLSRFYSSRYLDVMNAYTEEKTLLDAEKEVFDFNHSDIGRWLADKWKLPDTILDSILYHHMPALAKSNMLHVATVHVADYIVDRNVIRPTTQEYVPPFDHSCLPLLGISEEDMNNVEAEVKSGEFFNELFTL